MYTFDKVKIFYSYLIWNPEIFYVAASDITFRYLPKFVTILNEKRKLSLSCAKISSRSSKKPGILSKSICITFAQYCRQSKSLQWCRTIVFSQMNTAAFIKILAFPILHLFKGGVFFKIVFLKSLTTVTVSHYHVNII